MSTLTASRSGMKIRAILFVLILSLPLAATAFQLVSDSGTARQKLRAPAPAWPRDLRSALKIPGVFKWYFEQRFGLRDALVRLHGLMKVSILDVSSSAKVLIGKDGWLFLRNEGVLDYHRHSDPFTPEELLFWVEELESRRAWLAERGIEYLIVAAPNKHTVYAEKLPSDLAPTSKRTRLDQLIDALRVGSTAKILDLRPALLSAKDTVQVYHATDTHWNLAGGWYGSRAIANAAGLDWPDSLGTAIGDIVIRPTRGGDLSRMLGLATDVLENEVFPLSTPSHLRGPDGQDIRWTTMDIVRRELITIENLNERPRAVLFRDSLGESLLPWLSQCFSRSAWRWTYEFDTELLNSEKPNLVIQEIAERRLWDTDPKAIAMDTQ